MTTQTKSISESLQAGLAILHKYTTDIEIVVERDTLYFHVADLCGNDQQSRTSSASKPSTAGTRAPSTSGASSSGARRPPPETRMPRA